MKLIRSLIFKYGCTISAFALMVATTQMDGKCWFILHQPEVPQELLNSRE